MFYANWSWWFRQLTRRLFFRAALIAAMSVLAAVVALFAGDFIPDDVALKLGSEAVESVLTIIASSMLAVTTFSLSTVVSAHASASSNTTPRATELLLSDTSAQTMLSTFVGAFIYSLVGIILLKTGIYGPSGRLVLFGVTIGIVVLLVVTLLGWIDFLLRFGRLAETMDRVENAARSAVEARRKSPHLGGLPLLVDRPPPGRNLIHAKQSGYLQHVDMPSLQRCAREHEVVIHLLVQPGTRLHCERPLAFVEPDRADEELAASIRSALAIGPDRSFFQDPRFGLIVMAEIASRALSPAVNDPGTAISAIGRASDVIALAAPPEDASPDVEFDRVRLPSVETQDLFDGFFHPVARDGAALAEVQIRIQKALRSLSAIGRRHGNSRFEDLARLHSRSALRRAEEKISNSDDIQRVRAAAEAL